MWFVEWRWFERVILLMIGINTVAMASKDYSNTWVIYNGILEKVGLFLNIVFAIESIVKIVAYGFILGKNTYMRNSWNILDFIIVLSSLVGDSELKLIRLIRVMKPLRTIRRIPTLRK